MHTLDISTNDQTVYTQSEHLYGYRVYNIHSFTYIAPMTYTVKKVKKHVVKNIPSIIYPL